METNIPQVDYPLLGSNVVNSGTNLSTFWIITFIPAYNYVCTSQNGIQLVIFVVRFVRTSDHAFSSIRWVICEDNGTVQYLNVSVSCRKHKTMDTEE